MPDTPVPDKREWRLRLKDGKWTVDLHRNPSRPHEQVVTVVPKRVVRVPDEDSNKGEQ